MISKALNITRFKQAEYGHTNYDVDVEHGTDPADILDPGFWAHVASLLKVRDRIFVTPDSLEWTAELVVVEVGASYVRVVQIRMDQLSAAPMNQTDVDFTVEWKGPIRKWSVIRKSDKAAIYESLPSRDAAEAKLTAHIHPVAA